MSGAVEMEEGRNPISGRGPSSDLEGETNRERQEHMRHLKKEAFQLANYYFVFQGLIFTGIYNAPPSLQCEYRWFPFALSFLAGFFNLCALYTIALKYKAIHDDIDKNSMGSRSRINTHNPGNNNNTITESSSSSNQSINGRDSIAVKCERHWRLFYVVCYLGLFLAFFVITLIGCWTITCGGKGHHNEAAPAPPNT